VYRKGAEVIRMYATLLGRAGFRKGMDLYFQRHDGSRPLPHPTSRKRGGARLGCKPRITR
jgi:hypothetical protein